MKNRKTARALAAACLVGASVFALVGCSSDGQSSGGAATLEFWQSGDVNQGGGYARLAEEYKEETGVTVNVVEIPSDDLSTRLRTAAQADDLPALAAAPSVDPAWSARLLDLTKISDSANIIDTLRVADPSDDEVKAMPTTLTSVGMFLNKSLWDQAGVEYPTTLDQSWTWDEFVQKASEVVEKTDAEYGAVMDSSAHRMRAFLYEFGSQGVTEQSDGTWALDQAGADAIEYFKGMHDSDFMPASVWVAGDDPSATFKSGRVAAYMSGVWQIADFESNISDFEWVSVPLPQQPVRATNYGAASWIVGFDGTGVEQETEDFITWLYSQDHYTEYCEISGCLPAESGLDITYKQDQYAFDLYNDEIAASPDVSAVQTTDQLRAAYEGKTIDSEPLKDEVVKYLNNEQPLDDTVANIGSVTTEQLGN